MITYKSFRGNLTQVFLDGRLVGTIKPVNNSFAYYPRGSRTAGETLPTIEAVKSTLEEM